MSATFILNALKFLGLGVAAASTLWGLTTKTTFDDEQGRKRLTAAGHVAVALILCASLIAAGSAGLELLVKQNLERAALETKREDLRAKQEEIIRRESQARADAAERRAAVAEQRADAAALRAAASDQRVLTLAEAAEDRSRDVELARTVNQSAQDNLAKAELALGQLERVLQPIGAISVTVMWELPADAPGVSRQMARITEFSGRVAADPQVALNTPDIAPGGMNAGGRVESFAIMKGSTLYPNAQQEKPLADVLNFFSPNISLFAAGASAEQGLRDIQADNPNGAEGVQGFGDLRFSASQPGKPELIYMVDSRSLWITIRQNIEPRLMKRTGLVVSIPDLERGLLAIEVGGFSGGAQAKALRAAIRPYQVVLRVEGRDYRISGSRFIRYQTEADRPAYIVTPVSPRSGPLR